MTRRPAPPAPPPERLRQLRELAAWHRAWVLRHADTAAFNPQGRKSGSDYNQHYVDLDDGDGLFDARARQIMGIPQPPGESQQPAAAKVNRIAALGELDLIRRRLAKGRSIDGWQPEHLPDDVFAALVDGATVDEARELVNAM